jgi:hypothetical protein
MAQTVATVRGSVSGSSPTLFTQSGGNATRVILNQVFFVIYSYSSLNIKLRHVPTNGGTSTIGWWFSNSANSGQLCPNPNGTGPLEYALNSTYNLMMPVNGAWVDDSIAASTNGSVTSYAPQNFWIGPGDSIRLDTTGNTTCYYHFTTITES